MAFNILELEPTVISRDLSGKYILLYSKPKVGKTTFAAQLKNNLFLATEIGYNAIDGIRAVPISKWVDIKTAVKQLRDPKAHELYKTVTIDTITLAADLCEKYILAREGVQKITEVPYGQGWKMVAKELQDTLREITILGYGLILICHSKEKASGYSDADGNPITSVEPDLSKNIYSVASAICDLIAYIGVEFDDNGRSKRWLYTRQTPTIFAGSRWRYLDAKIPFGYDQLVEAIGLAIKKQEEEDGAVVVDHIDYSVLSEEKRSFLETMEEAKEIWENYINNAKDEEDMDRRLNIIKDIVGRIFGNPNFKISQAIPSQQDLVEYFITEVKDIL